jgi:hypothetical protein
MGRREGIIMLWTARPLRVFRAFAVFVALALLLADGLHAPVVSATPTVAKGITLYDPDPKHPWNRLHDALRVRLTTESADEEFLLEGEDIEADANKLDPMLWRSTWHFSKYLLTGPAGARYDAAL